MHLNTPKCLKRVGEKIICPYCQLQSIKYCRNKTNKQRYYCKGCCKTFLQDYAKKAFEHSISNWIINLTKEGCGIRSIARLLQISTSPVLRRILYIAKLITKPVIPIVF